MFQLLGGDVTSDSYVSKPVLESVLGKVVNETNKVTKNTLQITGNHDYNAGERDAYDSAPYYEFYMKENVGELSDLDSDARIKTGLVKWKNQLVYGTMS